MKFTNLILGFICFLFLHSCFKNGDFDSVPNIKFNSFESFGDSAKLIIEFNDKEGDIGLNDNQTEFPYNIGSEYYYNIYVNYLEKNGNKGFVHSLNLSNDTISFPLRIKPILDINNEKPIQGTIEITLSPLYYNPFSKNNDTIKYKIQIIDRALNKSNIVESNIIIR